MCIVDFLYEKKLQNTCTLLLDTVKEIYIGVVNVTVVDLGFAKGGF